ncbi:T9SS type A sorting domain-containing protein [Haliscomenobacter sp.]|uniref:T9SS type A sorting domain-containing protein n=1 Tax=Haliscomenobacter sp. TaxID=2717303 RepID=UPI003BAC9963
MLLVLFTLLLPCTRNLAQSTFNTTPVRAKMAASRVGQIQRLQKGETPQGLEACSWQMIQEQIKMSKFKAHSDGRGGYCSVNQDHGFQIIYGKDGSTRLSPRGKKEVNYSVSLRLKGLGYQKLELVDKPQSLQVTDLGAETGSKVSYQWNKRLSEWWINDSEGLEQWFYLQSAPGKAQAGEQLRLRMELETNMLVKQKGNQLLLEKAGTRLSYDKLRVWDAKGKELEAQMAWDGTNLDLLITDAAAEYPLLIDPSFTQQAYLKASNTNAGDEFGYSVAISGETIVVGTYQESSNATGVNGDQSNNSAAAAGAAYVFVRSGSTWSQQAYLKASNTEAGDFFGYSVAISGETIVVGAHRDDSNATGVNGDQSNNSAFNAGAAYVFVRSGSTWSQQAYLKASNTEAGDIFGYSVAISGETIVVGANGESSNATGVNGDQSNNNAIYSGAAYVFVRSGVAWSQQAYLKASNTEANDGFGYSVAIAEETIVVGANAESSNATGINGDQSNNTAANAGAAYVFVRSGSIWSQQAYLKASNTNKGDWFSRSLAISGETIVVGAWFESSNAIGVNGNQSDNTAANAGAAYVFVRSGSTWSQQAYLKASNTDAEDYFGFSVAISGETIVVGAYQEASNAIGINGDQSNNNAIYSGAAYVFVRNGGSWSQQTYLKASNTGAFDKFGTSVAISEETIVVGAVHETSNATGINGDQSNNSAIGAGATYVFAVSPCTDPVGSISSSPSTVCEGGTVDLRFTATGIGPFSIVVNGITYDNVISGQTFATLTEGVDFNGSTTFTLNAITSAEGCSVEGLTQEISVRVQDTKNVSCQDVTVTLGGNCQFELTSSLVSEGALDCGTVRVMDNNPSNGNIIDCAGVWTYGLFDAFGNIICWGKVTAEDKTAPILVCAPADVTLDCYDVNYVLNNRLTIGNTNATSSPRPAATSPQTINNAEGVAGIGDNCQLGLAPPSLVSDNIKNLGYAYFKDNCYSCGCRITLKWSDKVVFYNCDDMKVNGGIYATISREWVATDCNGMSSAYVQKIQFKRPDVRDFVFKDANPEGKYDHVIEYNACTPDKSLIKKEDVTPYVCSYFNNPPSNPRCLFIDQVECNYSVSIKDTEFPICGGKGVKIDRELYVFDWCAGGIVDTFHILIKIGDFTAPTCEYAHGAPYDISTGPMDCTAAIPVTVAGIKSAFGVTIKDNCNLGNISVSVYTKDRYVKGILVYEGPEDPLCEDHCLLCGKQGELRGDHDGYQLGACDKDKICWDKVEYAVMNGMMIGLPVGKHLMVIDAFDGCYNASTCCFVFEVKDKIAPVMKCDDDLHVTLSNANGYTNGYAQVSAEDIDEGSWDNCKLAWIAARRNVPTSCAASFIAKGYDSNNNGKLDPLPADGDWTKADGFDRNGDGDLADFGETFILKGGKLMTPLADFVEFFCCDLAERVTVELWGEDVYGNTNYCWMDLLIEDKVAPTCLAPWDVTVYCDDKNLASIDSKVGSAAAFGDITIPSGNDCAALDTVYTTEKKLKCGAGYIDRIWTLTKETVKGPISVTCKQRIHILPVYEYNICFPKDVSTDCKTPIIDTVITDELACDILAVNVSDKRYDASDDECYKIFRTYSVINWCTYDDRCGDPLEQTNIHVIDRGVFGNYGKDPIYLLVRDRENNRRDGDEEFWISKDLTVSPTTDLRAYPYYCDESEEYYHSFIYTQIIKVYDDTRPVVTGDPAEFCIREGADCLANLKMVITGKDNCSDKVTLETQYLMIAPGQTLDASKMILYSTPRWSTKDLGNGQFEINVANLPEGKHDLIVVVRDECGNLSVATRIPFTVKDCKGPAPICINGLSTGIMPDGNGGGMMAVWASDFVASKIYDCNGQGPETKDGLKLVTKYSINRVGQPANKDQTGLNFTCADIANSPILVELHAWDNAGNHDFCITFVELIDSRGVCPGSASGVNIAGTISTEGNANLQGASITLSGAASQSATTAANGGYSFVNLAKGGDFTVTPQLDKNHLNGVSTFDLVLIQKHILGVTALNSPYKMIAADVNNSKTISTLDLIALRKLILNIDTHFANNTSWRFVDASYTFPNANNPWAAAFPEVVSINDIASNVAANFVAIKVGDVNASASVNGATSAEIRTSEDFKLKTQEQNLKAGNEYKVSFSAEDLKNIQGYQFALTLDQSKAELLDIEYGVAKAENFGVFKNEGIITTSWNSKYEPGALFTLVLRAKADAKLSSALSLNRLVSPEAYDQNNENLGIALNFEGIQATEAYELRQNTPNPFSNETVIGFTLPKALKGTLTVRDVKGALIYKVEGNYTKGNNQVSLKKSQLGASGVLYYTLETTEFTATKKMVILE